jgi:hypothetical protein
MDYYDHIWSFKARGGPAAAQPGGRGNRAAIARQSRIMPRQSLCYYTSKMSCPYFYPLEPRAAGIGSHSAMLPLGDAWAGVCRAIPDQSWQPDDATLRPLCNLGYARGRCPRFPSDDGPDAVRFTISRDDGAALHIYHVIERDHHPYAHGPLEYSLAAAAFTFPPESVTVGRQAQAYVDSYLRRKKEASRR